MGKAQSNANDLADRHSLRSSAGTARIAPGSASVGGCISAHLVQDSEGLNHSFWEIPVREVELPSGRNGNPATTEENVPAAAEDDEILL